MVRIVTGTGVIMAERIIFIGGCIYLASFTGIVTMIVVLLL